MLALRGPAALGVEMLLVGRELVSQAVHGARRNCAAPQDAGLGHGLRGFEPSLPEPPSDPF